MKKKFFLIFILSIIFSKEEREILNIQPDKKLTLDVKLNEEILLKVNKNVLLENHFYKIMIHFIGSLGITFKINIICNDIYVIEYDNKEIDVDDFSEYDFKTNNNKIPNLCGNDYDKNFFIISLLSKSISYQFREENKIKFKIIFELITNKINTDIKPINILTNKGLYKGLIFVLIIVPIMLIIFKNKIQIFLIHILNQKELKSN
jgi:hypothetical protein